MPAGKMPDNKEPGDQDDVDDDNISTDSNQPTPNLLPTTTLRQTMAYQQLLNTTGSSYNLTALATDDLDSDDDDDIERNILPRRPGPTSASSPRQPAVATDSRVNSREIPNQEIPSKAAPSVSALSSSAKKTDNKEKSKAGGSALSSAAAGGLKSSSRDNIVFKANNDPDIDDEDVTIPTVNMSGSGGQHASRSAEDEADDFDDF